MPPAPTGPRPSAEEKEALRRVRLRLVVDHTMQQRLRDAGWIKQVTGGWVLTDNGALWDAMT